MVLFTSINNPILDLIVLSLSLIHILMDVAAPEAKRISAIRNVRNYTFHFHVDDYLNVIRDAGNPQEVRVVTVSYTHLLYNV